MGGFTDKEARKEERRQSREIDEEFKRLVVQGFSARALTNYFEFKFMSKRVLSMRERLFKGWKYVNFHAELHRRKREKGCRLCGYNLFAEALEFHHIEKKEMDVARLAEREWQVERIWREVRKCVVLCKNCHRLLTAKKVVLLPVDLDKYWMELPTPDGA